MSFGAKIANSILNNSKVQYLTKPTAVGAASTIALISNTSKDAVNCYYYVTQSMKNEKIPEEKRKFVAALDLSNGILNIITQLALGIPVAKAMNKVFDKKIAPKYFSEAVSENVRKNLKINMDPEKFYGAFSRNKGFAKSGLGVITTLVVTQIISKRIIVPLIATPMASYFKKKMNKTGTETAQNTNNINQNTDAQKTPDCFKSFQ